MINKKVLDHVIPEQHPVVDSDEAEEREGRRNQRGDERRRPPSRPTVSGLEAIHPDHAHR